MKDTTNKLNTLKSLLELFPEVMWDRMPDDNSVFGWIERNDNYKDFMLLDLNGDYTLNWYITSSSKYSSVFAKRLNVDHTDCKRVEDIIEIKNSVKLKDATNQSIDNQELRENTSYIYHYDLGDRIGCHNRALSIIKDNKVIAFFYDNEADAILDLIEQEKIKARIDAYRHIRLSDRGLDEPLRSFLDEYIKNLEAQLKAKEEK